MALLKVLLRLSSDRANSLYNILSPAQALAPLLYIFFLLQYQSKKKWRQKFLRQQSYEERYTPQILFGRQSKMRLRQHF